MCAVFLNVIPQIRPKYILFVLKFARLFRRGQSELVSQTVVRCRVPPGPSRDGTVRVPVRVEVPSHSNGLRRSTSNNAGFDGGSRGRGQAQGVVVFEYREPASSPSNSAPALSRCGTPRVREILRAVLLLVAGSGNFQSLKILD